MINAHTHTHTQTSVTLSSRQRYSVRHRTGGETSLYLANVPKDILKDEVEYIKYVKELIAQSKFILVLSGRFFNARRKGPHRSK